MQEIWKDILEYEGLYQISNFGHIKRIVRGPHTKIGKILKPSLRGRGKHKYMCVCLYKEKTKVMKQIHRMMLESFVRPFVNNEVARHLNGNTLDNNMCNLQHGTQKMNLDDRTRHGNTIRGSQHWQTKLSEEDVQNIRLSYNNGDSNQLQLAKKFGVKYSIIWRIINRRTWKHVK